MKKPGKFGTFTDVYSYSTTVTREGVTVQAPSGQSQAILWNDIVTVKVKYAEVGLLDPDYWLVLVGKDGECQIPRGGDGERIVFNAFFHTEGFDLHKFSESNDPVGNNSEFVIWRRVQGSNTSSVANEHVKKILPLIIGLFVCVLLSIFGYRGGGAAGFIGGLLIHMALIICIPLVVAGKKNGIFNYQRFSVWVYGISALLCLGVYANNYHYRDRGRANNEGARIISTIDSEFKRYYSGLYARSIDTLKNGTLAPVLLMSVREDGTGTSYPNPNTPAGNFSWSIDHELFKKGYSYITATWQNGESMKLCFSGHMQAIGKFLKLPSNLLLIPTVDHDGTAIMGRIGFKLSEKMMQQLQPRKIE